MSTGLVKSCTHGVLLLSATGATGTIARDFFEVPAVIDSFYFVLRATVRAGEFQLYIRGAESVDFSLTASFSEFTNLSGPVATSGVYRYKTEPKMLQPFIRPNFAATGLPADYDAELWFYYSV